MASSIVVTEDEISNIFFKYSKEERNDFLISDKTFFPELRVGVNNPLNKKQIVWFAVVKCKEYFKISDLSNKFYILIYDDNSTDFYSRRLWAKDLKTDEILEMVEPTKKQIIGFCVEVMIPFYACLSLEIENENRKRLSKKVMPQDRVGKEIKLRKQLVKKIEMLSNQVVLYQNEHGKGTKHSYEYEVRGFIRHYKSGKEVYIRPTTRCKGRGRKVEHQYSI